MSDQVPPNPNSDSKEDKPSTSTPPTQSDASGSASASTSSSVGLDDVARQSHAIVSSFLYERFSDDVQHLASTSSPNNQLAPAYNESLDELENDVPKQQDSMCRVLGKVFAKVGDDVNVKYKRTFQEMIEQLSLTPDIAYDLFQNIVQRLFRAGITWGRIIALLCFGYRIAVDVIQKGRKSVRQFIRFIVENIVKFIVQGGIAQWIADHGGWWSLIHQYLPETQERWFRWVFLGGGFLALFVVLANYIRRLE